MVRMGGGDVKKISAIALVLLLLIWVNACAEEILFRDIPYESNVKEVLDALGWSEQFYSMNESLVSKGKESLAEDPIEYYCEARKVSEVGAYTREDRGVSGDCGYTCVRGFFGDEEVAGHRINFVELTFLYGVNNSEVNIDPLSSNFVSASYMFAGGDVSIYEDILDKLKWLYGEPTDSTEEVQEYSYPSKKVKEINVIWEGENDTELLLYARIKGEFDDETHTYNYELDEMELEYGKSDMGERIEIITALMKEAERNEKYNAENTSGL